MHPKAQLILCAFLFLAGCIYVPIPWDAWRYKNASAEYYSYWYASRHNKNREILVNGAFVRMRSIAHNETTQSGDPPYYLVVSANGLTSQHLRITIYAITVVSSLGSEHRPIPIRRAQNGDKLREIVLPADSAFTDTGRRALGPIDNPIDYEAYATLSFDETLDFQPQKGESFDVVVDIEVFTVDGAERREVRQSFEPKYEEGLIGMVPEY